MAVFTPRKFPPVTIIGAVLKPKSPPTDCPPEGLEAFPARSWAAVALAKPPLMRTNREKQFPSSFASPYLWARHAKVVAATLREKLRNALDSAPPSVGDELKFRIRNAPQAVPHALDGLK